MASGRIPGPFGVREHHGCVYLRGVLSFDPLREGFEPHTPRPFGTGDDIGGMFPESVRVITQADRDELRHLQEVYGVISKHSDRSYYTVAAKNKRTDNVENYLKDRDEYIAGDFALFKAMAKAELDADNEKLRKFIEPPEAVRLNHPSIWKDAQTAFYCWVRKGILNSVGNQTSAGGAELSVPQLIMSGESPELKQALASVRATYNAKFKSGGYNARPQKHGGKYMLAAISDHALGKAVDVESEENPQIPEEKWKKILAFTGQSLDLSRRKAKWKSNPKELYDEIEAINDVFVTKLAQAIDDAQKAADKAASAAKAIKTAETKVAEKTPPAKKVEGPKAVPTKDSLDLVIEADANLKSIGKPFLKQWQNGFFSLEWELVKAFNESSFTWGAAFRDVDLHHFQL